MKLHDDMPCRRCGRTFGEHEVQEDMSRACPPPVELTDEVLDQELRDYALRSSRRFADFPLQHGITLARLRRRSEPSVFAPFTD